MLGPTNFEVARYGALGAATGWGFRPVLAGRSLFYTLTIQTLHCTSRWCTVARQRREREDMSDKQIKVSGSSADIALECNGSMSPDVAKYNQTSDDARLGTAKHAALAAMVDGGHVDIDAIAEMHEVDSNELYIALASGRKAWSTIETWAPGAMVEVAFETEYSRGTADVLSVGENIVVVDWKTGRSGDEHQNQLKCYADAARRMHGMRDKVFGVEVFVALGEYVVHKFTEDQLDAFAFRCKEQIARVYERDFSYSPGAHCKYCQAQNSCVARVEYIQATANALAVSSSSEAMTRSDIAMLYDRAILLESALKRYNAILKSELDEGPLSLPGGRKLQWREEARESIGDTGSALDLVAESFGRDVANAIIKEIQLTKTAVNKGASALKKDVINELREAGFVASKTIKKKEIVNE